MDKKKNSHNHETVRGSHKINFNKGIGYEIENFMAKNGAFC